MKEAPSKYGRLFKNAENIQVETLLNDKNEVRKIKIAKTERL